MDEIAPPVARHHLLIAGTGRAGTSFLVRYLDALGFETHFSKYGAYAAWDEDANAGAENLPLSQLDPNLPYVIKSPWATEMIEQIIADPGIVLDAVVIPLRDIMESAASRSILELRHMAETADFWTLIEKPWAHRGYTPGGIVYSLHPLDQARIMALGFHHLVERLTAAEIPIVFLSFPRLASDADYLHRLLAPVLNRDIGLDDARAAHEKLADPGKIRVQSETTDPALDRLDRIALARELARLQGKVKNLEAECASLSSQAAGFEAHVKAIRGSRMWRALEPVRRLLRRAT